VFSGSRFRSAGTIAIRRSGEFGLLATGSDVTLEGVSTVIVSCGRNGLAAGRSSSVWLSSVLQVSGCSEYGILLFQGSALQNDDTASVTVTGTSQPWGVGIGVGENSVLRANGGAYTVENNTGSGFEVFRNATLSLRNRGSGLTAAVQNNGGDGITLYQQGCLRADEGLSITGNGTNGILLAQASEADLGGLSVTANGTWGISADDGSGLVCGGSTVSGNSSGDIVLQFGSRSSLNGNTIGTTPITCDGTVVSRGDVVCP
jgi:hypothetical protein